MLIDDVFVGRVLREEERKRVEIQADCQERVVFALHTPNPIVLDGRLEEDVWSKTARFGGFRAYKDQTVYATKRASFRAIFDASSR